MLKLALSLTVFTVVLGIAGTAFVVIVALDTLRILGSYTISLVAFLFENWVIQAAFGAWVAFQLQERSATIARRKDRLQLTYDRKVEATKSLYSLIERRIYASRRYLTVIETEPASIQSERDHYRSVVAEWNEQVKISQVTILLEFDSYIGLTLDHNYFPSFVKVDRWLRRQRQRAEANQPVDVGLSGDIRRQLSDLNVLALEMVREMLKTAARDRNIMDETIEISEENLEHLSYGRLFKAIFQPS